MLKDEVSATKGKGRKESPPGLSRKDASLDGKGSEQDRESHTKQERK